jgi:hypothetical protein
MSSSSDCCPRWLSSDVPGGADEGCLSLSAFELDTDSDDDGFCSECCFCTLCSPRCLCLPVLNVHVFPSRLHRVQPSLSFLHLTYIV